MFIDLILTNCSHILTNTLYIKHRISLGDEDLDKYNGSPFLIRASGQEQF
jgi:DNA/RNA-binding domain of Phe-tRNA-synthetase-like protein